MNVIFEGSITTSKVLKNLPDSTDINFLTDSDVTIEFFIPTPNNPATGTYAPAETLVAPGGLVGVPSQQMRITGTGKIRITQAPR